MPNPQLVLAVSFLLVLFGVLGAWLGYAQGWLFVIAGIGAIAAEMLLP